MYLDQKDRDICSACLFLTPTLPFAVYGSSIAPSRKVWSFSLEFDPFDPRFSRELPPLTSSPLPRWVDPLKYGLGQVHTFSVGKHEKYYVSLPKPAGEPIDTLEIQLYLVFRKALHTSNFTCHFFQFSSLPW